MFSFLTTRSPTQKYAIDIPDEKALESEYGDICTVLNATAATPHAGMSPTHLKNAKKYYETVLQYLKKIDSKHTDKEKEAALSAYLELRKIKDSCISPKTAAFLGL